MYPLPRDDPAPTSEGQWRSQAHAHDPSQRFPGTVDDAALPQANLEEQHPPHTAVSGAAVRRLLGQRLRDPPRPPPPTEDTPRP